MYVRMRERPKASFNKSASEAKVSALVIQATNPAGSFVQGKGACACGGVCPACEERAVLQPKLQVSSADDQYEKEADRVADQVMQLPEKRVQRQALDEEENEQPEALAMPATESGAGMDVEGEEFVQPKLQTGKNSQLESAAKHNNLRGVPGRGEPLPATTRSFFNSRMGYDFSQVRIHRGADAAELAGSLNARAFTLGRDIVFNRGEYAPHSVDGKRLLAHELTHVIQQQRGPMVQRKIMTRAGCLIDSYLANKGVTYSRSPGNTLYVSGSRDMSTLDKEILSTMLLSGRRFFVAGTNQRDVVTNLDEHVKTRKRVIHYAAMKKYRFAAGSNTRVNKAYWGTRNNKYHVKPGKKAMDAYLDMIKSNSYAVACHMATKVTMYAGTNDKAYAEDKGVNWADWIPGDWGYIENLTYNSLTNSPGQEGENMIYVGKGLFWGHISAKQTYKMISGWWNLVRKWGIPWLLSWRRRPTNGLT